VNDSTKPQMDGDRLREENAAYLSAPWHWRPVVRRTLGLPKWAKYILLTAADYANADGTGVRPGTALLAVESESSYSRVQEAVRLAARAGLLFLARKGNRRKGQADEFWLILHPELMDRVTVETPTERKERAAAMVAGRHSSWVKKDDEEPIVRPTGAHDESGSCVPPEFGTESSCVPPERTKDGSCVPPERTTSLDGTDLPTQEATPSDELDLCGPVTDAREAENPKINISSDGQPEKCTQPGCSHGYILDDTAPNGVALCPTCHPVSVPS
jgi:hypothetical protein